MRRRYIYDKARGKVVPLEVYRAVSGRSHEIMTDLATPFRSPVDGEWITSREQRRQHNARNGVEDVGNDPAFRDPVPPGLRPMEVARQARERREAVRRAIDTPRTDNSGPARGHVRIYE